MGADPVLSVRFIRPTLVQLIVVNDLYFTLPAKQDILVIFLSVCLSEISLENTGVVVISVIFLELINGADGAAVD